MELPQFEALVAGAVADGDGAADIAGGGIVLEVVKLGIECCMTWASPVPGSVRTELTSSGDFVGQSFAAETDWTGRAGLGAGAVSPLPPFSPGAAFFFWMAGAWSIFLADPGFFQRSAWLLRPLGFRWRLNRRGWGCSSRIAGDELTAHPAEDIVNQTLGERDILVGGHPAGLEAGLTDFFTSVISGTPYCRAWIPGADDIHQAANGAAFFGHGDKQFAGLPVFIQADGQIALVAGD